MSVAASLQAAPAKAQASVVSAASGLLQRKCACGSSKSPLGKMCDACQSGKLQRKLAIGASNDPLESEADRIADQVLAGPAYVAVTGAPPRIQRFSGQSNGQMDAAPASVDHALASPGRPLEPALRQDMEQRFGHDFSRVRVHSGAAAEQSARDVNANAYTVRHNMVFDTGRFAPGTHEGRRLIAHELTHVVQQSGSGGLRVGPAGVLQRQPEDCPPGRFEEPEHSGECPEINRARGESRMTARQGEVLETLIAGECYLLTNFPIGSDSAGSGAGLEEIIDFLQLNPSAVVHLTGFSDCLGSKSTNTSLRTNRASALEDLLVSDFGVDRSRIILEHTDLEEYVDTNSTLGGRARNRSVAIYISPGTTQEPADPSQLPASTPANAEPPGPYLDLQLVCLTGPMQMCTPPGGTPTKADLETYGERCKQEHDTGYAGPTVYLEHLKCGERGLAIAESLEKSYPGWRFVIPLCPCTEQEVRSSSTFEESNSFITTYHPGAANCFRSTGRYQTEPGTSHRQQCCYDDQGKLITEGAGAGTPDCWSSLGRHLDVDVDPWERLGSETYNRYWVPDNRNGCPTNRKPA